ncbi:hypothetical protein [Vitreimonas flagellata]|uniref:hypothetical protein n=1 Tax=Vitreimonas flagellata TaxID=2560861 RepID=UPI001074F594|nr:hypothetical protein [Vitreimonas flagellata]
MRKLSFLAAAAAAALLAGCGFGAPAYPEFSETSYRIEGRTASLDTGATTQTVIYRDGPKMRVEATLPTYGQATIVFDESTNAAYVLNPTGAVPTTPVPTAQPSAAPAAAPTTTQPAPTNPAAGAPAAPPAAAPAPQVIGVAVRIQDADAPQPLETAWAALGADNARSTGRCEVAGEEGHEWTPREAPAPGVERTACITSDGIVLRVRENERVLWEATSLQRGEQDVALFGVPAGYQLIDPQAVAEQVGENLQQLDSVTGATTAPAAPTPAPQPAPDPRG